MKDHRLNRTVVSTKPGMLRKPIKLREPYHKINDYKQSEMSFKIALKNFNSALETSLKDGKTLKFPTICKFIVWPGNFQVFDRCSDRTIEAVWKLTAWTQVLAEMHHNAQTTIISRQLLDLTIKGIVKKATSTEPIKIAKLNELQSYFNQISTYFMHELTDEPADFFGSISNIIQRGIIPQIENDPDAIEIILAFFNSS